MLIDLVAIDLVLLGLALVDLIAVYPVRLAALDLVLFLPAFLVLAVRRWVAADPLSGRLALLYRVAADHVLQAPALVVPVSVSGAPVWADPASAVPVWGALVGVGLVSVQLALLFLAIGGAPALNCAWRLDPWG